MDYKEQKAKFAYELHLKGLPFKKVYGAVKKGDKFVVLKRENGKYKYEIAGGSVELNEANETAIKREILEELNFNVKIVRSLGVIKYLRTWKFQDHEFDIEHQAEIFLTEFVSYGKEKGFGLDGEFNEKEFSIAEISKEEMLANVAEFVSFGIKLD